MTLIEVRGGGDNHLIGRCDARCYLAQEPECDCICGGRNHGVGRKKAQENTARFAEEWLENYKKRKGITEETDDLINASVFQTELF